jgi:hypothetical protein
VAFRFTQRNSCAFDIARRTFATSEGIWL